MAGPGGSPAPRRRVALDALAPGSALELRRDAGNAHDANAIEVLAGGAQVSFVPRELAAELAAELDAGPPVVGGGAARAARLAARPRSGVTMLLAPAEAIELRPRPG